MITSTLSQLFWYKAINPNFAKAIDFALTTDLASLEMGRHDIDRDNVFAIVNEYTTRPAEECDPESHRDYADIQIMIAGVERFGYAPLEANTPTTPYDEERDVAFYTLPEEEISYIRLSPGQFIIFFPTDIHQPEVFHVQPQLVKKIVFKVRAWASA
ncbi:MAG TPA: YhcH/YjgK/YiaL family protein [Puia sp.]|nr:YhcH/YjgK/YiaL family protein [Puia sp.]